MTTRGKVRSIFAMVILFLGIACSFDAGPAVTMNVAALAPQPTPTAAPYWDPRLDELNITLTEASDCSDGCWKLKRAIFLDQEEAANLHHVFAKLFRDGVQVGGAAWTVAYPDGAIVGATKEYPDYGDIPLWHCYFPDQGQVGPYRAFAGTTEAQSDVVQGLALPYCLHVSYKLEWEWINGGEIPTPTATAPPLPEDLYLPIIRRQ